MNDERKKPVEALSEETVFCYVAAQPGMPGFCAAAVDEPKYKKDTAKDVAQWVRQGLTVSRVSVQQARDGLGEYLKHKRPQAKATEESQQVLL